MREQVTVPVPAELSRRCVRLLCRHISDVPGVVSLQVEPGHLIVVGDVEAAALRVAVDRARSDGCGGTGAG